MKIVYTLHEASFPSERRGSTIYTFFQKAISFEKDKPKELSLPLNLLLTSGVLCIQSMNPLIKIYPSTLLQYEGTIQLTATCSENLQVKAGDILCIMRHV